MWRLFQCIIAILLCTTQDVCAQPIEVVYHIATLNRWEDIAKEQLQTMQSSGLGEACDHITITVVGPHIQKVQCLLQSMPYYSKVRIIHAGEDVRLCEFPGIEMVQKIAHENTDANILYFHSKGVSHQDEDLSRNAQSWRRYMEYFTIECWKECIEALQSFNACGVEWLNGRHSGTAKIEIPGFFAGNFWWARADYLCTCQKMSGNPNDLQWSYQHRYDCEAFITTGQNLSPRSFHQSGINLYLFNYTPEYYKNENTNPSNRIEIVYNILASINRMTTIHEQIQLIQNVGLMKACDRLTAIVLGPETSKVDTLLHSLPEQHKVRIIHANSKEHLGEFQSIELVKRIAKNHPDAKICYLNNSTSDYRKFYIRPYKSIWHGIKKAVVRTRKELVSYIKTQMRRVLFNLDRQQSENQTIKQWQRCLEVLKSHNICGAFWKPGYPKSAHFPDIRCHGYFADNCWWARADYLNSCQDVHYHSPFDHCAHLTHAWLHQYFADCQMFIGTGDNPLIQDIAL
ncbi:MAG: hypothetical protein HW387_1661 [Parachlamydiales bacterium]|nr:hypothetical protein [Parachlamydiales bacterium]